MEGGRGGENSKKELRTLLANSREYLPTLSGTTPWMDARRRNFNDLAHLKLCLWCMELGQFLRRFEGSGFWPDWVFANVF